MAKATTAGRMGGPRSLAARLARVCGALLTFLIGLALVLAVGVYLRLKQGPISLEAALPTVQSVVSERLPGARVVIDAASITLSETRGGAALSLTNVRLLDDANSVFARAPKAEGIFNIAGLVRGEVVPRDVVLTGVSARIIRREDGSFSLGFGDAEDEAGEEDPGAAPPDEDDTGDIFASLLAASTSGEGDGGQRLVLEDASVLYLDRESARVWRASDVDVSFRNTEHGMQAQTNATISGGRFGDMTLSIGGYRTSAGDIYMSAAVKQAAPVDIADQISALDWLAAFDAPVSAEMDIVIDDKGELLDLRGSMRAGAGVVKLGGDVVEPLSEAAMSFEFAPESGRFMVSDAHLASDRATVRASGFAEVARTPDGDVRDVVAQLDLTDLKIAAPEALDAPLTYDRARVTGRITIDPFVVELGELRLEKAPLAINAAGRITVAGEALAADMTLSGGGLTVQDLMAHWPRQAAPGARVWMLDNMEAANVPDFDAIVRLGGETEEVKFDFSFTDAVGHYLRPMPPVTDGVGAGQVDLKRFSLSVDSAIVTPEGGAPLQVGGSTFVIADLDHPASPADINLLVEGSLEDALKIVDHPPLGFISKLGVPLDGMKGDVKVKTYVFLPLLKALLLEDVEAEAEAVVTNLSAPIEPLDTVATSDLVNLKASTSGFSLDGVARVKGIGIKVGWDEVFATGARDVKLDARVTPKQLEAFGLKSPWFEEGNAKASAAIKFTPKGPEINFSADLDDAGLKVEEIGWLKAAGEKAGLKGVIVIGDDGIRAPSYELTSRDLIVEGNVALTPAGDLKRFKFRRLQYRGAADASVRGVFKDQAWNINIDGALLDLTKFDDLMEGGDSDERTETPLNVRFDLAKLKIRDNLNVTEANGVLNLTPAGDITGRVNGLVGGVAPLDIRLRNGPTGGEAVLRSPNAGELMREAGFFDDGAGGELVLVANIDQADDLVFSGNLKVDDIVIHEDAKLEKLLLGADLAELREKMRDDGIVFNRIRTKFQFEDGKVSIDDAIAAGPSIGVNLEGSYAIEDDDLDIDGVFTPLYALNSLVGEIPLLGKVLTGGDGQGLFAFNFSVNGAAEDPDIWVNPLSVLTPGIFRKIFSGGGDSQSSDISIDEQYKADR